MKPASFKRRLTRLILLAWFVPAVFGLSYLVYIEMFSLDQMAIIMTTPLEPLFIGTATIFSLWYLSRVSLPLARYLEQPGAVSDQEVIHRLRGFPWHFWLLFLGYLILAPASVIVAAERYTDFAAGPIDWFRIHLVALIVAIIVGLPIFFRMLDLFGEAFGGLRLDRPHVTIRTKVFLIGAFTPLLIDTMIVQYYWTRTGYFTTETFIVWLGLEVIAVLGAIVFAKSFGQSLAPLEGVLLAADHTEAGSARVIRPRSTDELGVLASGYGELLEQRQAHSTLLRISNQLLRERDEGADLAAVAEKIVRLTQDAVGGDTIFLILHEPQSNQLVGVAQTGERYNADGYYRLELDQPSLAVWAFMEQRAVAVNDAATDPRVSPSMRARFNVISALATPLWVEGEVIGVLMSAATKTQKIYGDTELELMEGLAREVALSVHNQRIQTERLEAEAAQQRQREQIQLLMDSTAEAIIGVDNDGTCTFANPACLRMLGYRNEEELLGKNVHETIHHSYPDGSPYPKQDCRVRLASLARRSAQSDEEVHWRADGSPIPVEWWSHPIQRNGELIGTVITFVDISERKRANEELRRLSEYNRLLLDSTGEGIFGVDDYLRITFANRAAAEMLGYSADQLTGKDAHSLLQHSLENGEPYPRNQCPIFRAVEGSESFVVSEEVLWRRDGTSFPVQYSVNPLRERDHTTGAVVVFRDIAEARAMARKMDYLATHDALTGLINRVEFERRLEHVLSSARRGAEHALCYMDLDQFKIVNDTCGHVAGDELLRQLSGVLHAKVRQSDTLARLGGDEFGVLLEHCPTERAMRVAEDLRMVTQEFRFAWEDRTFAVGLSVGVVPITEDTRDIADALSAADTACYMAKDSGRNRVHIYHADDAELTRRRGEMRWVARIHEALEAGHFYLSAQSIFPVGPYVPHEGEHFEVLLRMRDIEGQEFPPTAFIPAAERYNLMPTIDRWVVARVFQWLRQHRERLNSIALCTINLSGHSLSDEHFHDFLAELLQEETIPPEKICFEVTETAAVANLPRAVQFVRSLRDRGCSFALDDFGSGMSSFAYLKNIPVDFLKIDGNFVRDMAHDPIDRAMVAAINQIGHVMGIRTIAEFVENREVLAHLQDIGVDYAQGYGLARPAPLDDLL